MSYIYCIYTDKEILEDQTNLEHIIPLSLGGSNDFVIRVDKQVNSTLGAKIDGKLANDFPIQMLRMHKQAKGHSRKKVTAKFKKSKIISSKKPVQVDFTDKGLKIFDPIEKRHIEKTEYDKIELQSIYTPDGYARIRFTAKTLLAAGYFVYGGVFRQQADHAGLREYMNSAGSKTERGSRTARLRLYDQFSLIQEHDQPTMEMLKLICEHLGSSSVVFGLGPENIFGTVGLFGQFIGSINFKAEIVGFPNEGDYRLGHIIYFKEGRLVRKSLYDIVVEIGKDRGIVPAKT